jgi:hypothetical protein
VAAPSRLLEVQATFAAPGDAEKAAEALLDAGIEPARVTVQHAVLPEARGREGRFVWRVLVIIVFWSIVGAVPGALSGLLLALTIGPGGTAGLIVQLVCWIIVGHLIGGMLAGYFVLADRRQEEMPPDRSVVTVRLAGGGDEKRVWRLLRLRGPMELRMSSPSSPSRSS